MVWYVSIYVSFEFSWNRRDNECIFESFGVCMCWTLMQIMTWSILCHFTNIVLKLFLFFLCMCQRVFCRAICLTCIFIFNLPENVTNFFLFHLNVYSFVVIDFMVFMRTRSDLKWEYVENIFGKFWTRLISYSGSIFNTCETWIV